MTAKRNLLHITALFLGSQADRLIILQFDRRTKFKEEYRDHLRFNRSWLVLSAQSNEVIHMKFTVDPDVFQLFPELRLGVVIASEIDNTGSPAETIRLLRDAETKALETMRLEGLTENPLISNWRVAYKSLRIKDGRPSHEALIRRVLKGGEIPHINKLVDIYNSLSIKYTTPFGGEDLDRITGDLSLGFASGSEDFVQLGSSEITHPDNGEVIYSDSEKVLCRKFNWRESDLTKLTESTRNAFFVTETLTPFPEERLDKALVEFADQLRKHCGAKTAIYKLDRNNGKISWQ